MSGMNEHAKQKQQIISHLKSGSTKNDGFKKSLIYRSKGKSTPLASGSQPNVGMLKKRARGLVGRRPNGRGAQQQPKVFRCPLESCGKIFHDRASLKKHNTVHGDKLFQCTHDGCGKRFLDNAKLKRHMLVHTGEKPYKCDLCNKRFSLDFNLKTHMRIHTGEKPFICPYSNCSKRFNQKSNLHAHQLTHHLEGCNGISALQQIHAQNGGLGMSSDIDPSILLDLPQDFTLQL